MKINHFFILLVMFVLLVSACTPATSTPQPDQVELAKIACQSTGGSPVVPANAADPASVKCVFQDGSNCDGLALLAGTCTQVSASTGQAAPSPTPYPTKEQAPPSTPEVKGPDPYPGWATYTNSAFGFAFRYPDTWQVEESPNLVRLTQPGIELMIYVSRQSENLSFTPDLPYNGSTQAGESFEFFGQTFQETQMLVDGQVLAVTYGPTGGMPAGDLIFTIYLSSLQSDQPLPEQLLGQVRDLLGSFEEWNNYD
jgi:putative hemolysin